MPTPRSIARSPRLELRKGAASKIRDPYVCSIKRNRDRTGAGAIWSHRASIARVHFGDCVAV